MGNVKKRGNYKPKEKNIIKLKAYLKKTEKNGKS